MKGHELTERIIERLQAEFGALQAVCIVRVLIEEIGGIRVSFPDLQDMYTIERNRRIAAEFDGRNYEELAIKYRLNRRHLRRIVNGG